MGYITKFNLKVFDKDWKEDKTIVFKDEFLEKNMGSVSNPISAIRGLEAKWYVYHLEMISLSREYSDYLFQLNGVGEDDEDFWVAYYLNGKSQTERGIVFYPPYDKDKLK